MKVCGRHGLPHPTLMRFVLKLLANLTRPARRRRDGPGDQRADQAGAGRMSTPSGARERSPTRLRTGAREQLPSLYGESVCDASRWKGGTGMTLTPYIPILVLFLLAGGFAVFSVVITGFTGPKRYNRAKLDAYECGIEPSPQPVGGGRFPVKFYLTAMLFIVFDIEIVFLYPCAVREQGAGHLRAGRDGDFSSRCSSPTPMSGAAAGLDWSLGTAMGLEEKLPSGVLLTTVEKLVNYARKASMWPMTFGLACCAIEMMAVGGSRFDIARFGMERFSADPAPGRPDDRRRPGQPEDGSGAAAALRPDARAQVGDLDGRLRQLRRHVQQLRHRPGRRPRRPGRHVPARLPAAARRCCSTRSSSCTTRSCTSRSGPTGGRARRQRGTGHPRRRGTTPTSTATASATPRSAGEGRPRERRDARTPDRPEGQVAGEVAGHRGRRGAQPAPAGACSVSTAPATPRGYGGLVRRQVVPGRTERPFGGYFDEVARLRSSRPTRRLPDAVRGWSSTAARSPSSSPRSASPRSPRSCATTRRCGSSSARAVSGVDYRRPGRAAARDLPPDVDDLPPPDPARGRHLRSRTRTSPASRRSTRPPTGRSGRPTTCSASIFDGHPALTRILMPDDWEGHPQRKDYPLGGVPVEYKGAEIPPPDERRAYR